MESQLNKNINEPYFYSAVEIMYTTTTCFNVELFA
jgi:hypothetical protein